MGVVCALAATGARHLRRHLLDHRVELPRAALRRHAHRLRARHPGIHPRARRRVLGQNPAPGRGQSPVHDRRGALTTKRVLVTGGAGFIPSNFIRHLLAKTPYDVVSLDALTYAGNLENLADVMSHERLSFVQGDIRDAELVREVVAERGRDRQRRGGVARREVDSRRRLASSCARTSRGRRSCSTRSARRRSSASSSSRRREVYGTAESRADGRGSIRSTRAARTRATKAGADRLAYSYFVTYELPIVIVRPFNNYGPRQHPGEGDPALHHAGAAGRAADGARRRARDARLAVRRRRRRGDRGRDRGAARARRRRGAEPRDRESTSRSSEIADKVLDALGKPRVAEGARSGAARPGRPPHRLDREGAAR